MKCPECNRKMEMVILEKAGPVWICDHCGLVRRDGTATLVYPSYTGGNSSAT